MALIYNAKRYRIQGEEKSFFVPKKQYTQIPECIRLAKQSVPGLTRIVLFGSCARGEARYDSDIDLCMITKEHLDTSCAAEIRSQYMRNIEAKTDIVFLTETGLRSNKSSFVQEIEKDGVKSCLI